VQWGEGEGEVAGGRERREGKRWERQNWE